MAGQPAQEAQAISADAPFALACFDLGGAVTYADAAYSDLLGRDSDEILGHSAFEFILAEDFEDNRRRLPAMIETGEPTIFRKHYVRPDGTIISAHVHAFALRDGTGEAVGICGILHRYGSDADVNEGPDVEPSLTLDDLRNLTKRVQERSASGMLPGTELRRLVAETIAKSDQA